MYVLDEGYGSEDRVVGMARAQASDIGADDTRAYLIGHQDRQHYGYECQRRIFGSEPFEEEVDKYEIEGNPYPFSRDERHGFIEKGSMVAVEEKKYLLVERSQRFNHVCNRF